MEKEKEDDKEVWEEEWEPQAEEYKGEEVKEEDRVIDDSLALEAKPEVDRQEEKEDALE